MSAVGSSADSSSICAAIRFAISSSTCCPSTTIRCWSSRSNTESLSVMDVGAPRRMVTPAPRGIPAVVSCWLTSPCLLWCSSPVVLSMPTLRGRPGHRPRTEALFAVGSTARHPGPGTSRVGRRPAALGLDGRLRLGRAGTVGARNVVGGLVRVGGLLGRLHGGRVGLRGSLDVDLLGVDLLVGLVGRTDQVRQVDGPARLVGDRGRRDGGDQRLAPAHVRVDRPELARLLDAPDELLRGHLVLLGLVDDPLGELLVVDRHLLLLGEGVEDQAGLDVALGLGPDVRVELLARLALGVEELGEPVVVVVKGVHGVVDARLDLGGDDALRQRDVRGVDERVEDLVAGLGDLLHALDLAEPGAQVFRELVEGVELAGELRELVVRLGELALLDRRDDRRDLGVLARVLPRHELGGERGRLAGREAAHGLVEAVDQPALAHLVGEAGGGGLLHGLAVDGRRQVEQHEVVVARGPLDAGQGAEAARRLSSSSVTAASSTSTSSTVTVMPSRSGSEISGRTSTSAVNARWSPSAISVTSMSGRPIGLTSSAEVTASEYLAGIAAFTTSSSTTPRPRRASRIRAGALPGRKPGMRTCWAILRYARSKSGLSSSNGTSTLIRTRVGLSRSTVLFTGDTPRNWCGGALRAGTRCGTITAPTSAARHFPRV